MSRRQEVMVLQNISVSAKKSALIDLHLHLDGSLSVQSVKILAEMQGITIPQEENVLQALLQVGADCKDLNTYLEKFSFPISLLQTKEALCMAAQRLNEELKAQGLLYAEIRFAPQKHCMRGLCQAEAVEAVLEGMGKSDLKSGLILCCMRGKENHAENSETVRVAKDYLGKGVCALDLAGAEALYPTESFAALFAYARSLGVPYTMHAGEADGPKSVYAALQLGAKRIGHGVRAWEDAALMKTLSEEGTTLELCPTSNMNTAVFESFTDYPIRRFLDAEVRITINTDNMTVSGVTLQSEWEKIIDAFALTEQECRRLVQNAADASFADAETKAWLHRAIEERFCGE